MQASVSITQEHKNTLDAIYIQSGFAMDATLAVDQAEDTEPCLSFEVQWGRFRWKGGDRGTTGLDSRGCVEISDAQTQDVLLLPKAICCATKGGN